MFVVTAPFTHELRLCAPDPWKSFLNFPRLRGLSTHISTATETAKLPHPGLMGTEASPDTTAPSACVVLRLPWLLSILTPMAEGIQLLPMKAKTCTFKAHSFALRSFSTFYRLPWMKHLAHLLLISLPSRWWRCSFSFFFFKHKSAFYSISQSSLNFSVGFWQWVPQVRSCYSLIYPLSTRLCGCCSCYRQPPWVLEGPGTDGDAAASPCARHSSDHCCSPTAAWLTSGNSTMKVATS